MFVCEKINRKMKIVKMKSDYSQCKCIDFKHYLAANLQCYSTSCNSYLKLLSFSFVLCYDMIEEQGNGLLALLSSALSCEAAIKHKNL